MEIAESWLSPPAGVGAAQMPVPPDQAFMRRYAAYRDRLRFNVADPANRCDTYVVSPGMVMAVVDVGCKNEFASRLSGQDIVEFHYRLSGSLVLAGQWGEVSVGEASCLLWYQPVGCDDVAERLGVPDRLRETWVSLYCDRHWLQGVGGAEVGRLLAGLAEGHGSTATPQFRLGEQIAATLPVLRDIVGLECRDGIDWLYAIGKAHELLHVTLRNGRLIGASPGPVRNERDLRRLAQVRGILDQSFVAPPTLAALARRVGLNPAKLCAGFRRHYGETTSGYVRRLRLEHAQALLSGTDLQVREIARQSGYRHHSTFTAAYRQHFGVSPKRTRHGVSQVN
ncbi:MAG: AraC family transcriptional regulator [Pseudomonadota bacterium]